MLVFPLERVLPVKMDNAEHFHSLDQRCPVPTSPKLAKPSIASTPIAILIKCIYVGAAYEKREEKEIQKQTKQKQVDDADVEKTESAVDAIPIIKPIANLMRTKACTFPM